MHLLSSRVLYPRYDLRAARSALSRDKLAGRPASLWRYFELLPVRDEADVVTLGEEFTPILRAQRLERELGCKAE